jgi:putative membrane protein
MMDDMMGGTWGWGMMLGMSLLWVLLLVAFVALVVWVARAVWQGGSVARRDASRTGIETPVDILRRRYAAGELSREEFERMKRELAEP